MINAFMIYNAPNALDPFAMFLFIRGFLLVLFWVLAKASVTPHGKLATFLLLFALIIKSSMELLAITFYAWELTGLAYIALFFSDSIISLSLAASITFGLLGFKTGVVEKTVRRAA